MQKQFIPFGNYLLLINLIFGQNMNTKNILIFIYSKWEKRYLTETHKTNNWFWWHRNFIKKLTFCSINITINIIQSCHTKSQSRGIFFFVIQSQMKFYCGQSNGRWHIHKKSHRNQQVFDVVTNTAVDLKLLKGENMI